MADIAVVFGWAPQDMAAMSIEELANWWHRARIRAGSRAESGPDNQ